MVGLGFGVSDGPAVGDGGAGVSVGGTSVGTTAVSVGGAGVGGGGVSVGGNGVSDGWAVGVGTGVSEGRGVAVGVKVLVNRGRSVLSGVGEACETSPRPAEQPNSTCTSNVPKAINNRVRILM